MSRALALAALAAVLFISASAAAATSDTPPGLPAVTIPTLSTPVVTTPPITTPIATVPAVTVKPPTPPAPPVHTRPEPPPVETPPEPVTPTGAPPPATFSSPTGSSSSSWSSPVSTGATPAAHRAIRSSTTFLPVSRFQLARPATVHVTVWQEAPRCRFFGRFRFTAARGTNELRLPHRIAAHPFVVGRYRLVGLVHGRNLFDERVRVERANGRLRVRKIHAADGCIPLTEEAILSTAALLPVPSLDHGRGGGSESTSGTRGASKTASAPTTQSGPQGSRALPQLSASVQHTLIVVLLALAIALLTISSLPESTVRSGAAAGALGRHRAALTSAGLAMIVAAALALFLT